MTLKPFLTLALICWISHTTFAQSEIYGMTIITEEVSNEITTMVNSTSVITTETIKPTKKLLLKADLYPNPSNLGNVRLLIENLPNEPVFIQIFNDDNELIKEGVINGGYGASIEHTLKFPDTSGNYSIKLSDSDKILQNLELRIL